MTDPRPRVLLVEDDPAVRASLATALQPTYEVTQAADVPDALAALVEAAPDVVVLDLVLNAPVDRLHQVLVTRGLPVLLISGADTASLQAKAEARGWRFLAKPFEHAMLRRTVEEMRVARVARAPAVPDAPRPTIAPAAPVVPAETPAEPAPTAPRDPRVEVADLHSRRLLRGLTAVLTTIVTLYFESRGHTVPTPFVVAMSIMALGVEGAFKAAKARPGLAAGGAAALVTVALLGDLFGMRELSHVAVLGVGGGIPIGTEIADRLRL